MEENTQLPKEVVEEIEKQAEAHNNRLKEHAENEKDVAYAQGFAEGWYEGATAYAKKLHQVEKENEQLRGWKMEAAELLTKIHSYAHKHLEIKLGQFTVEFVIGRAKERDELKEENAKLKEQATGWRLLLEDILRDNRNGYIDIDEALCSRIKKFLYGE